MRDTRDRCGTAGNEQPPGLGLGVDLPLRVLMLERSRAGKSPQVQPRIAR